MKSKITLLLLFLMCSISFYSQQLVGEVGKSITKFEFKNTNGGSLDNLQFTTQNYMYLGYRTKMFKDYFHISLGLSYSGYGTIGSDNNVLNFMEWQTNYAGLNLGFDLRIIKLKKINFYIKSTISSEFMVNGTQTLNNVVYSLAGKSDFNNTNFIFKTGAFIDYPISKTTSLYIQYMGGKSVNLNKTVVSTNQEKLRFVTRNVGFGLLINIKS